MCLSPGLQVHIYLKSVRAFVSEKLWRALQVVEFVVQLFFVKNLDTTPRLSPRFLCSSFSQYPRLQRDILWVCPQVFQKQTWPIVWFRFVTVRVRRLALPSAEHCVLCELVQNLSTACGSVMFACCVAGNVVGWKWTVLAVVSTSCTPSAKHFFWSTRSFWLVPRRLDKRKVNFFTQHSMSSLINNLCRDQPVVVYLLCGTLIVDPLFITGFYSEKQKVVTWKTRTLTVAESPCFTLKN